MSVATEISRLQQAKKDIRASIQNKGVTVPQATTLDGYAALINQISTGSQESEENDVNFYDYDGFRVASFTITEAQALTQEQYSAILPPTHEGLTFQEWNWNLTDIKAYNRRYIDIGANYITTDGKTHIFVTIPDGNSTDTHVYFWWGNGTLDIDWGDGSSHYSLAHGSTFSGAKITHSYSVAGNYELKIGFTQSQSGGDFGPIYRNGSAVYWKENFVINEWRCGNYVNLNYSGGLNYCSNPMNISTASDTNMGGFAYSHIPILVFPRNVSITGLSTLYTTCKVSLPKQVSSISGSSNPFTYNQTDKIVLPEFTSGSSPASIGSYARIMSYPNSWQANLSNSSVLQIIDIVNGWVPTVNLTLSSSKLLLDWSLVDFLTKLGATNSITITLGQENLSKLTADQKAIATNKGYTLA